MGQASIFSIDRNRQVPHSEIFFSSFVAILILFWCSLWKAGVCSLAGLWDVAMYPAGGEFISPLVWFYLILFWYSLCASGSIWIGWEVGTHGGFDWWGVCLSTSMYSGVGSKYTCLCLPACMISGRVPGSPLSDTWQMSLFFSFVVHGELCWYVERGLASTLCIMPPGLFSLCTCPD